MIDHAQLWIFRHGLAEGSGKDPNNTRAQDAARRLTGQGVKQSKRAGALLAQRGPEFSAIYTSPTVRCVHSAALIGKALKLSPVLKSQLAEPPASGKITPLVTEGKAVLIVGHGHYLPDEIKKLTGRLIDMDKGGLLAIRIRDGQAKVERLYSPSDVKRMVR